MGNNLTISIKILKYSNSFNPPISFIEIILQVYQCMCLMIQYVYRYSKDQKPPTCPSITTTIIMRQYNIVVWSTASQAFRGRIKQISEAHGSLGILFKCRFYKQIAQLQILAAFISSLTGQVGYLPMPWFLYL